MDRSKEQLLELTRCGLWGYDPDLSLFEGGVDWSNLLQRAKEQTITGLILPIFERLPSHLRPLRGDILRVHQMTLLNKQYRTHQIEVLRELLKLVNRAGVARPVLLKGLGVGLNYLDPTLRQCGDIDLYVGEREYERVWDFVVKELAIPREESHSSHHFEFQFMDTTIEIHRYAIAPNSIAFRSKEFMAWSTEQLEGDQLREVSIEGVSVFLPPYNFDFIFIFFHAWRHFLMGGIGFRQLCDWSCYINTFHKEFDYSELNRLITLFKLQKPLSLFALVAIRALGVAPELFVGCKLDDDKLYDGVIDRIWSRGNFGYCNEDLKRRDKRWLLRKTLGVLATIRDASYLMKIDVVYALKFYCALTIDRIKYALQEL